MKPLFAIALVLCQALAAQAQDSRNSSVETTIDAQIEAFLADDVPRAFTYASPSIRSMFRTPENFGAMVRRGYPMVWRPSSVDYLDQSGGDGQIRQVVRIIDGNGTAHLLEYQMIELESGWKINGVRFLAAPEPSV
ncbi:MAG: DUF4864 domain-containing protein [Marinibacterium sp.]